MLDSKKNRFLLGIAVTFALFWLLTPKPIARPPGILAPEPPLQEDYSPRPPPTQLGPVTMQPLATYRIKARVLSRERYWWDIGAAALSLGAILNYGPDITNGFSDLSGLDLGLGWQRLSDSDVIKKLEFEQRHRFLFYRWENEPPIPEDEIRRSLANVHVIAADEYIKRRLNEIRVGQVVTIEGELVALKNSAGAEWRSSLTREDTGAGACEILWAKNLYIE